MPVSFALLELLQAQVLLCDGGLGSQVQSWDLELDRDFWGKENCTEVLLLSRPELVRSIHQRYFEAGADMVETNSFGGSPITLGEFDLQDQTFELNRLAGEIARQAAEVFTDGRQRFVLGAVGPGTRLPTLGHVSYQQLEAAFQEQCRGLIAGGVDAILIETCQDPLQIKAAVNGARAAAAAAGAGDLPILVQVTVEATGSLLVGSDIAAAATIIQALGVNVLGINCATGPAEMEESLRWLSEHWPGLLSCQPNAGIPELVGGKACYPLSAEELSRWHSYFIDKHGLNLIGGCCGTTPEHIAALDKMLQSRSSYPRPAPSRRSFHWIPAVSSLYTSAALRQENAYFSIGERCNANGSRQWRLLQERNNWDGCLDMARRQVDEGCHALDICTAFVGRDEKAEMNKVVSRFRGGVTVPLVIDSTEYAVLEQALQLYGGKAIINSINLEDGEEPVRQRLQLARRFGAAVVALTIDEGGMARTAQRKLDIARRLYELAADSGLAAWDLLFDPLTFTIATGAQDDRRHGIETLDGIEAIAAELPQCQIILGLSNISFGLKPQARAVVNAVFLDHALRRGLTGAILHKSKIAPLHQLAPEVVELAEELIFDRRGSNYDPLHELIAYFADQNGQVAQQDVVQLPLEQRLVRRIVDGLRQGLELELTEALASYPPLTIINQFLLDGMKQVGELFGAGKMQLPFVLQAAETMKAAVSFLEPYMERVEGQHKGTIVLATVRGDVHDIGKNLVDIILTNNGYRVCNLGIKQPVASIMEAALKHQANAVGMSGLLVKSTVVMRENLEEMTSQGLEIPVLLGGAALTRGYVEEDCTQAYRCGRVAYARDAFDGLNLMAKVVDGTFDNYVQAQKLKRRSRRQLRSRSLSGDPGEIQTASPSLPLQSDTFAPKARNEVAITQHRQRLALATAVPTPPFWGARILEQITVDELLPYLNKRMLYQFQWGFRKQGRGLDEYMTWARSELQPILEQMVDLAKHESIFAPVASYGYWPCAAEGDSVVLLEPVNPATSTEIARFNLPRQRRAKSSQAANSAVGLCIADFFRDRSTGEQDVIALQVVTVGERASQVAREWFAADRYQDYLYLHGLGVELTEALAEFTHARIRSELGFADRDATVPELLLQQGYRGSRYSFGYPACPQLEDQEMLLRLLRAEQIGVVMSEESQLHPEQSTSALVAHHPQARYFSV